MQNSEKVLIKNEIQKEIFRRSFFEFVKWASKLLEPNTDWKFKQYHAYLCQVLQEETIRIKEGGERKYHIIINVPFRSGKSLICSICYPIWSWIINPTMSFINLSYSDLLSTDHSNKVMAILQHPKFQELFDWEFDDVQRSKTDFKLKIGGQRLSGGITGTVLGRGADCIIMDDANNTKRLSQVERHNTIKAWKDTISTRLNNPATGLFINIQQRLHQEDLTGHLTSEESENWFKIVLPAELSPLISPPELVEFYEDGLLWQERFSRKVLDNFKTVLGSVNYNNQLLQSPIPDEGILIKKDWIPIISYEEFQRMLVLGVNQLTNQLKKDTIVWDLFVDTAYTKKQENDPSAILVACKYQNAMYVRKAFQVWLEFPDLIKKIKEISDLYCKQTSRIFVETKASGHDVVATLKRETDLNVIQLETPKDDKETRLNSVSPIIEGGRLILIEDTSNDLVIGELTGFPNAKHDDVMDTVVYGLRKYLLKSNAFNYAFM